MPQPDPPLRVLVVSAADLLTDHRAHGEGLIAHAALGALAAQGHELTVFAREVDLRAAPPYRVTEVGRARSEALDPLAYARRTRRLARRAGAPDAFDVAWWMFPWGREYVLELLPRTLPLVVGPWQLGWPARRTVRHAGDLVRLAVLPLLLGLHGRTARRATWTASIPEVAAQLAAMGRPAEVVPFGIDVARFAAAPPSAEPLVLFVGRLEPAKGVPELVEAVAGMPGARLVLAGDGPLREELAQRDLGGRVEVLGAIPHEDIAGWMRRAAVVAAPSHGEPYGMAILEAMATGRPVVAGDAGGPRFLVDDPQGGRRVAPGDAPALRAALHELLDDPAAAAAAGRHNRARVEAELSLDAVAARMAGVLRAAVEGRR